MPDGYVDGVPDAGRGPWAEMAEERLRREGRVIQQYAGPRLTGVYTQARDEERARIQQEEAARIAALSPRELWLSTLPWEQRAHIAKWEQINRREWPFNG